MKTVKLKMRALSLLFAIIMVFTMTPLSGTAIITEKPEVIGGENISNPNTVDKNVYIIEEDISQRGEFEKHFLCSDGSYIAVSYPNAVHFKNDKNEWQDFDHSLKLDTEKGLYKASGGNFSVSLSQNTQSNKLITLQNKSHEISWTIRADQGGSETVGGIVGKKLSEIKSLTSSDIKIAESEITEFKKASDRLVSHQDAFALPKYSSQVSYSNVFAGNNISLRYTVDANRIKEDILIYEKSDLSSFIMDMQIGNLSASLNEDNSVSLLDKNGETQYQIGVPYLVDAAYEYSYDVKVTVEQSSSSCKITYTPDEKWLNADERVYPITLDPEVTTNEYTSNMIDTFAWKNRLVDQSSKAYLDVGVDSGDPSWAFITCTKPNVNSGYIINSLGLTLTVSKFAGSYSNNQISVYGARNWSTGSSLQPVNSYLESYKTSFNTGYSTGKTTVWIEFNGSLDYDGYILKFTDEAAAGNTNYVRFHSIEASEESNRPYFTYCYSKADSLYLPPELINGGVYAFKNASTGKYMSATSNANNANVVQQSVDSPSKKSTV